MMLAEPIYDLAHLAHLEMLTPKPEESLKFFVDVMGMTETARSPQALERRVTRLKGSGYDIGWSKGDLGHGPAFAFYDPDGHKVEIYYETEWYKAPPELRPALKNQAMRFPARGISVRRLDHLNCLAVDIKANRIFFE